MFIFYVIYNFVRANLTLPDLLLIKLELLKKILSKTFHTNKSSLHNPYHFFNLFFKPTFVPEVFQASISLTRQRSKSMCPIF